MDNAELENLIENMDCTISGQNPCEEFLETLKKSELLMLAVSGDDSEGIDIEYIKLGPQKKAVALFSSHKQLLKSGFRGHVISIEMSKLEELLLNSPGRCQYICINQATDLSFCIPSDVFLDCI